MVEAVIAWVASLPQWMTVFIPLGWIAFCIWISERDKRPPYVPDSDVEAEYRDRMGW